MIPEGLTSPIKLMVEILSFTELIFTECLLCAVADFSTEPHLHNHGFPPSAPIHLYSQRAPEQGRRRTHSIQCHFWKNTFVCFCCQWKVSSVTPGGQIDTSVGDRRTKMELPWVLDEERRVCSKLRARACFRGFWRWSRVEGEHDTVHTGKLGSRNGPSWFYSFL